MHFNTSKCNVITMTNKAKPHIYFYEMNGRILTKVDLAKYLGITIQNSLDFASHIRETASKANKKLGFLRRNLKGSPATIRKIAFTSIIRSSLEYGSTIWDPYLVTQRKAIEQVQNRAIRWIMGLGPHQTCSITQLRKELDLESLEERRLQQRLVLLFKVVNGDVMVTPDELGLQKADARTRSAHKHKFKEKRAPTDRLKFSPVFRTVPTWNRLPAHVAEAGSVDSFKSQLAALRS